MIKLGDMDIKPSGLAKVIKGMDVIWEKKVIKTLSWNLAGDISPYAQNLYIPTELSGGLSISEVLKVEIGGFKSINPVDISAFSSSSISFINDFASLLGTTDWLSKGTKITVTYK